jgi:hypothetical protein
MWAHLFPITAGVVALSALVFAASPYLAPRAAAPETSVAMPARTLVEAPPIVEERAPAEPAVAIAEPIVRPPSADVAARPHRPFAPPPVRHVRAATPATVELADAVIDPLLARAVDDALAGAAPAAPEPVLPATPTQAEVRTVLRSVEDEVAMCGSSGIAVARLRIEGASGEVTDVAVTGADPAVAACVAGAIERVRFPRFAHDELAVSFPYVL